MIIIISHIVSIDPFIIKNPMLTSQGEQCKWINVLFTELWPHLSENIAKTTKETLKELLVSSLNAKKPTAVVSDFFIIYLRLISLGIHHYIAYSFWKHSPHFFTNFWNEATSLGLCKKYQFHLLLILSLHNIYIVIRL
jgi:hypothetical protein